MLDMAFPPSFFPPLSAYEVCIFVRLRAAIASDRSLTINYRRRQSGTTRYVNRHAARQFTNCSFCAE
jgi:hypothetical protein